MNIKNYTSNGTFIIKVFAIFFFFIEISAVSDLVKKVADVMRKIIGDLSNKEKFLVGLNIVSLRK